MNVMKLAPYIPVSQGHTIFKPWWHSTLCCGLFDLALTAHIKNNKLYNNVTICKLVDVLLDYATTVEAGDGKVFTYVGEFFSIKRFEEFVQFIIDKSETDSRLELFNNLNVERIFFETREELKDILENRTDDDLIIFPYEPAYRKQEQKVRDANEYRFLHFGIVLPEKRGGKYHVIQSSRGRTVQKPVYRAMRLVHTTTADNLFDANKRTENRGYKWILQFPWKRYKGKKFAGFNEDTVEKYMTYEALGEALKITLKAK